VSDRERKQVCINLDVANIPVLREASKRLGITQNPNGSISAIVRHLADRIERGQDPFRGETFEESVSYSLLELAESLQQDVHLGEDEVVEILRRAAIRSFSDLQSQALDDIILDIRAILFGDDS
jgi:hypothetical protein